MYLQGHQHASTQNGVPSVFSRYVDRELALLANAGRADGSGARERLSVFRGGLDAALRAARATADVETAVQRTLAEFDHALSHSDRTVADLRQRLAALETAVGTSADVVGRRSTPTSPITTPAHGRSAAATRASPARDWGQTGGRASAGIGGSQMHISTRPSSRGGFGTSSPGVTAIAEAAAGGVAAATGGGGGILEEAVTAGAVAALRTQLRASQAECAQLRAQAQEDHERLLFLSQAIVEARHAAQVAESDRRQADAVVERFKRLDRGRVELLQDAAAMLALLREHGIAYRGQTTAAAAALAAGETENDDVV
jgi:hypothetical protein